MCTMTPSVSVTEQHCYRVEGGACKAKRLKMLRVLYFFAISYVCSKDLEAVQLLRHTNTVIFKPSTPIITFCHVCSQDLICA